MNQKYQILNTDLARIINISTLILSRTCIPFHESPTSLIP